MKIWEALAMLEQMDKTKECTVTFGETKLAKPFSGIPYPRDYVIGKEQWPESFFVNSDKYKVTCITKNVL
jgi:hypothetical protein